MSSSILVVLELTGFKYLFHLSYGLFTVYVLRSSLFSLLGFFNDASCMAALEAEHYLQDIGSQEGKID